QARFEQLQQALAGHTLGARCLGVDLAELALQHAVDAPRLLLLAQLLAVVREARAALLAVLAGRVVAPLDGALVGEALLALEEELLAFPAALPAFCVEISRHAFSWTFLLYAPALGRAAAVVRHGGDVGDRADLQADRIQRAHRGFAARAGSLDAHLDVLHAALLRRAAGALGGHLRGERRRLARALEARVARRRPGQRVALAVGDGNDGVVEGCVHVGDALGDVLFHLLARARRGGLLQLLRRRCGLGCHGCGSCFLVLVRACRPARSS